MAALRAANRLQIGSTSWLQGETSNALQMADAEAEEFAFSARNDLDWLNEHMAEIFDENEVNVAEVFKTPGKLRGKTPRTARKRNLLEERVPLSDVFSSTPKAAASPFRQIPSAKPTPKFSVAEDTVANTPLKPDSARRNPNNDSGYYGSQPTHKGLLEANHEALKRAEQGLPGPLEEDEMHNDDNQDERRSTEGSYESAKEQQPLEIEDRMEIDEPPAPMSAETAEPDTVSAKEFLDLPEHPEQPRQQASKEAPATESGDDGANSTDASSPVQPLLRKSSLNFPSLPAREPLTTKKSIGNRTSSQPEQNRTSYYGRQTGGKSMSIARGGSDESDEMDLDKNQTEMVRLSNKTSTQRLQDQISMLSKSQPTARASKSIQSTAAFSSAAQPAHDAARATSPGNSRQMFAPGAFPDDDDWIPPPQRQADQASRPAMPRSISADVVEGVYGKDNFSGEEFGSPKAQEIKSPLRGPAISERFGALAHAKSTSVLRSPFKPLEMSPQKPISVSNPNMRSPEISSTTPPKSPARSIKESPLKAAKDKLSSILKTSKGLFASSAAVIAEAEKISGSPTSTKTRQQPEPKDVLAKISNESASLYPSMRLQQDLTNLAKKPTSPTRSVFRKTRASAEREERDAREIKEMQERDELGKAKEAEREKARVFNEEKERVAAMEKQVQKDQDRLAKSRQEASKNTRNSPRKTKQPEPAPSGTTTTIETSDDVEMEDSLPAATQPLQRPTTAQSVRARDQPKRPTRPAKEAVPKTKAPVVIRVNTGSQQPNSFHPSNNTLAASLGESLAPATASSASAQTLKNKASNSSLHSKASTTFKSSVSSTTGKPKALEAAARKKEQDEREAQRKREAKMEMERKRAAILAAQQEEEKRQEQQRRVEAEQQRQREKETSAAMDAKKSAQRQAIEKRRLEIERAKQQRAPPPAARPQEKPLPPNPPRTEAPIRHGQRVTPGVTRSQDELARPANPHLQSAAKGLPKRPLPQDGSEEGSASQRDGANYQSTDQKRRRTSEDFNDEAEPPQKQMAPPVRQSSSRPRDATSKAYFPSGYTNASQPHAQAHQKPALQHMHQQKAAHPLDMTQTSKAPILFASSANGGSFKTPARPAGAAVASNKSNAKSAARSSPRYPNGENIELPEIHTDSEDEDSDAGNDFVVPDWANSPAIRAQLVAQDGIDPAQVFGPVAPLQMEEVFKNKDRWHRFRARTSSANWSGADRLTDDEIRKDLEARERLRREGGWTYGLS